MANQVWMERADQFAFRAPSQRAGVCSEQCAGRKLWQHLITLPALATPSQLTIHSARLAGRNREPRRNVHAPPVGGASAVLMYKFRIDRALQTASRGPQKRMRPIARYAMERKIARVGRSRPSIPSVLASFLSAPLERKGQTRIAAFPPCWLPVEGKDALR